MTPSVAPRLIWDIQVRHLDEADFLLEMWSDGLDSPKYTLTTLAEGPEYRFLAHVDALLAGSEPVLERLLLPLFDPPDKHEFRIAAATFTILEGAGREACERVLAALNHPRLCMASLRGLVCGLSLSRREGLVPWLARDLDRASGLGLVGRLRALAGHHADIGGRLIAWLSADDLEVRRAAAHLARHTADPQVLRHLYTLMASEDHELRFAVLESALIRGLEGAWERVCAEAYAQRAPEPGRALSWMATLGDHGVHQRLLAAALSSPTPELVWAAGLTGRAQAVDLAVELLEHPRLARLAGEVVYAVVGLPIHDDRFWLDNGNFGGSRDSTPDDTLPKLVDDDLDADLVPRPESWLRLPNPDSVRLWWTQQRPRFEPGRRYSRGRLLDVTQLLLDLRELPTRRRHHRALELGVRSAGAAQIETRSFGHVQTAQIHAVITQLGQLDCQRGLSFHA